MPEMDPGSPPPAQPAGALADSAAAARRLLPTPDEMIRYLDRYVYGQQQAKRDLSMAIYSHYLALAYRNLPEARGRDFGKQHILLFGPTGSGKTYMVRKLAEFLAVPVSFASATSLVETGYKGTSVDEMIFNLLATANNDVYLAQRGIMFIDEIDKIRSSAGGERDVSGQGVQNGLLTLLDGRIVGEGKRSVDTGQVLFVCTGAFVELPSIVRKRLGGSGFGYPVPGENEKPVAEQSDDWARAQVAPEDLQAFGFIPEFIGRFPTLTALQGLSKEDLAKILVESEGSILAKQKLLFSLHGVELEFSPEAIDEIAVQAMAMGTGARALTRIVMRSLDAVDWRLPTLASEGVSAVRIHADVVKSGAAPELVRGPRGAECGAMAHELRERALLPALLKPASSHPPAGISDSQGWSDEQVVAAYERVKDEQLGWKETTGSAQKWWKAFESENKHKSRTILRLCEELAARKATITEFFLAYVYSNTDNIQCNLHYLDYRRCKSEWDKKKKGDPPKPATGA